MVLCSLSGIRQLCLDWDPPQIVYRSPLGLPPQWVNRQAREIISTNGINDNLIDYPKSWRGTQLDSRKPGSSALCRFPTKFFHSPTTLESTLWITPTSTGIYLFDRPTWHGKHLSDYPSSAFCGGRHITGGWMGRRLCRIHNPRKSDNRLKNVWGTWCGGRVLSRAVERGMERAKWVHTRERQDHADNNEGSMPTPIIVLPQAACLVRVRWAFRDKSSTRCLVNRVILIVCGSMFRYRSTWRAFVGERNACAGYLEYVTRFAPYIFPWLCYFRPIQPERIQSRTRLWPERIPRAIVLKSFCRREVQCESLPVPSVLSSEAPIS